MALPWQQHVTPQQEQADSLQVHQPLERAVHARARPQKRDRAQQSSKTHNCSGPWTQILTSSGVLLVFQSGTKATEKPDLTSQSRCRNWVH